MMADALGIGPANLRAMQRLDPAVHEASKQAARQALERERESLMRQPLGSIEPFLLSHPEEAVA